MKEIKVKCPAKINLDLRVFPLEAGDKFHKIKSIMQAINLFDFLTVKLSQGDSIALSGTSDEIPYDETNLCHKAASAFFKAINKKYAVDIFIEKNIPVAAGLAGGSTDAAGTLYALNKLLDYPLSSGAIFNIASKLGSDLNFCLAGGTKMCSGKGDTIADMPFYDFKLSLIKPKNLQISAKEAYQAYDKMVELKKESNMRNDLEFALINTDDKKYDDLRYLTSLGFQMSGSGPTYFLRDKDIDSSYKIDSEKFLIINSLNSLGQGVIDIV